jgi:thiopeptide-type bacteriocin biosynthesis protein
MQKSKLTDSNKSWLAGYLYYAEPWERFLIDAVKPFIEMVFDKKLAEQFFFIRYWEKGPHIRLRFKGDKDILEQKLKPEFESFFYEYFQKNPSMRTEPEGIEKLPEEQRWFPNNSIQFIEYEPEIERYGGPIGILIAEKQFEISSHAVLSVIEESKDWIYDRALGAAIQLHLSFAFSLSMNLNEMTQFYSRVFKGWFVSAYGFESNIPEDEIKKRQDITLKAFEENFEKQKSNLISYHKMLWNAFENGVEFEQEWLNKWLNGMSSIASELKIAQKNQKLVFPEKYKSNLEISIPEENQKLWYILESYVHMTNNRLGILNRDEAYLGYLIKKSLENL